MKRYSLLVLAFLAALVFTELIVRFPIGYPTFGVSKYIIGLDPRGFDKGRVYKPFSKYYSTEGGFKVFKRNNLGLTGADVLPNKKYIYLLGSSYVEAMEVEPRRIAASVLNDLCHKSGYQVVNIAYRGNTPYEQYCRLRYYSTIYKPDIVLLVLDSTYEPWYKQRKYVQTDPSKKKNFGIEDSSTKRKIYRQLRNNSALVNLLVPALGVKQQVADGDPQKVESSVRVKHDVSELVKSIRLINDSTDKFAVVSFIKDSKSVEMLKAEMQDIDIPFFHQDIKKPGHILVGHLNEIGNRKLGEVLYESLQKTNFLNTMTIPGEKESDD